MVEPLRHRRTKGAANRYADLQPPRHTPTLPTPAVPQRPLGGQESPEGEVAGSMNVGSLSTEVVSLTAPSRLVL